MQECIREMREMGAKVVIFDNGGATIDRYTIYLRRKDGAFDVVGMSRDAFAPDGFNQFSHTTGEIDFTAHGERVAFAELPADVAFSIIWRICEP